MAILLLVTSTETFKKTDWLFELFCSKIAVNRNAYLRELKWLFTWIEMIILYEMN